MTLNERVRMMMGIAEDMLDRHSAKICLHHALALRPLLLLAADAGVWLQPVPTMQVAQMSLVWCNLFLDTRITD